MSIKSGLPDDDLTRLFYAHLASGKRGIPDPVSLPSVGTIAEFESIIREIDNMSDSQCREMLIQAMKLVLTQQKLLHQVMKPKM